jgi:hypothetical protein
MYALLLRQSCTTDTNLNWRDMVAMTFVREVHLFAVHATGTQDEKFIQDFNARANVNHYNGLTNNCSDFARRVIAECFTHATSPDYLNDFGGVSVVSPAPAPSRLFLERRSGVYAGSVLVVSAGQKELTLHS